MKKYHNNSLLEADLAVEDYLDTLLQEVTDSTEAESQLKDRKSVVLLPELDLRAAIESIAEDKEEVKPTESTKPAEKSIPVNDSAENSPTAITELGDNDKTSSYDFPMQCLMFRVANVQLSIPLIDLGSVQPWTDNLTRLPRSPDWCAGVLSYRDKNISVVDTAKLLSMNNNNGESGIRHVLVLAHGDWAISCDQLGSVIYLQREDVKWLERGSQSLALGTIKESLAQLLDPAELMQRLSRNST